MVHKIKDWYGLRVGTELPWEMTFEWKSKQC